MQLTLVKKFEDVPNVITFLFEADAPVTWKAGQFMRYILPDLAPDDRRTYRFFSISSAPHEKLIRITTRFVPDDGSTFKKDLKKLEIGSTLEATGPGGDFIVDDPDKKYVFIAGGIGITPFRAILVDLHARNKPINVTLLYANRTPDFIFKKELDEIAKAHPEFKIHYFVDPERIDEHAINSLIVNRKSLIFYVSGPEPMVEAFEKMLYGMGIPEDKVKRDYFPGYTSI